METAGPILDMLGVPIETALVVGDSVRDMLAAELLSHIDEVGGRR